jgi:hypothetical protein
MPVVLKLSLNQKKELQEQLRPLFDDFHDHQGWLSSDNADERTRELLAKFREWGVEL